MAQKQKVPKIVLIDQEATISRETVAEVLRRHNITVVIDGDKLTASAQCDPLRCNSGTHPELHLAEVLFLTDDDRNF